MNGHFPSVGQKCASNIPESNKTFSQYLLNLNFYHLNSFKPVLPRYIEIGICRMASNETHEFNSLPDPTIENCRRHYRCTSGIMINCKHFGGERSFAKETKA